LCEHCREALPQVRDLLSQYPQISVFTVNNDGFKDPCVAFLKTLNAPNWVNVLDEAADKSTVQQQFATMQLPTFYLLDRDKRIVSKWFKLEGLKKILPNLLK
jgi:thiol-disulfide isomerase/thioredoxin